MRWTWTAAILLASWAPGMAPAPASGAGDAPPSGTSISSWAYPAYRAEIHAEPADASATLGRLRFLTEDRLAEIYFSRDRILTASGEIWLRIQVLGRPNGRFGWVREDALGPLNESHTRMVIDRGKRTARLFEDDRPVWKARVGIGRGKWPTPAGEFYIRERLKLKGGGGLYGVFAFGTSAYSTALSDWPGGGVIGIHGTDQPKLIPGRISHGCIRLRNRKVAQLERLMPIGTELTIE